MEEIWKPIEGFENDYIVSNLGNVKMVLQPFGFFPYKEIKVKQRIAINGYFLVYLTGKNGKKSFRVNRLVCQAFHLNPENKPQTNHINGIKTDNRAENLEWCTASENALHAYKTGLSVSLKGEAKASHKLTEDDVRQIRTLYLTDNYRMVKLAEIYNVSHPTISRIISREKWKHIA